MLTCKFVKVIDHKQEAMVVVSARRVDVDDWDHGKLVTLYDKPHSGESGTEYRIGQEDGAYDHCYIENAAGKTIQHIRWSK